MKKITFTIEINSPKNKVFEKIVELENYKKWTAPFNPTSYFEGGWNKGDKIQFLGTDTDGKKGGMASEIADNVYGEIISIRHLGIVDGDTIITEGPAVESWTPAYENYYFEEKDGVTTFTAELDTNEEYETYFSETWPKALEVLKQICES